MKRVFFLSLCLCWVTLSFAQHRHAQSHTYSQSNNYNNYYQKGDRMIGLNKLSLGYANGPNGQSENLATFGIGLQGGRFIKDKLMLGARLEYQRHGISDVFPAQESRFYESYVFLRSYRSTDKKLTLFSEVGLGMNAQRTSSMDGLVQFAAWNDFFTETQVGLSWRLGRHLGLEASAGGRVGTDNRLTTSTGERSYNLGWTYDFGLNWYFR